MQVPISEAPPNRKKKLFQYIGPEPSVEQQEAEFWRIVEDPEEVTFHSSLTSSLLVLREGVIVEKGVNGLCRWSSPSMGRIWILGIMGQGSLYRLSGKPCLSNT